MIITIIQMTRRAFTRILSTKNEDCEDSKRPGGVIRRMVLLTESWIDVLFDHESLCYVRCINIMYALCAVSLCIYYLHMNFGYVWNSWPSVADV